MTLKPPDGVNLPQSSRVEVLFESPVNVQYPEYGARGDGTTDDTAAFAAAFNAANSAGVPVYVPPTTDHYEVSATLPTLTDSPGIFGEPKGSNIYGSVDGDVIVLKGMRKRVSGLYVSNAATSLTAESACIRVQNCAYGLFEDLFCQNEHADAVGFLLEQVYDGSDEDAFLLVHLGCWYNSLRRITGMYRTSTGVNVGTGVSLRVDASALEVVDPAGQPPGTYSGFVGFNELVGLNVEGKARGLELEHAGNNTVIGGQFVGCTDQVYGVDADANNFIGIKHNQWATNPYNLAPADCFSNCIINPSLFNTGSAPWSLGVTGSRPMIVASDESVTEHGLTLNDVAVRRYAADSVQIGTARVGASEQNADWAEFKSPGLDQDSYALLQSSAGATFVNAAAGQEVTLRVDNADEIRVADGAVGFFGTAPVTKPTGVAVTAAGVHAALVTLGLIAS